MGKNILLLCIVLSAQYYLLTLGIEPWPPFLWQLEKR